MTSSGSISLKPYVSLSASAGSGKTFALSVRFVALVLRGANIQSITALTFTKKAAKEMSERIISNFMFLHTEEKSSERKAICELLNISEDNCVRLRDEKMQDFLHSSLKITTFDAFFGMILRNFASYMGLSPDFEISESLEEIVKDKFLQSIYLKSDLLYALARYIVVGRRSIDDFFGTIATISENAIKLQKYDEILFSDKDVNDALNNIKNFISSKPYASNTAKKSFDYANIEEFIKKKSNMFELDSLNYRTFSSFFKNGDGEFLDSLWYDLRFQIKQYYSELEIFKISELHKLVDLYKDIRLNLNRKLNMLSFSDVTLMVYNLLCVSKNSPLFVDNSFNPAQLYFRLDNRISHLLIDEFQDTNVMQYEIMFPLIEEITSGLGQNGIGSFFYVGDVKQSIYRFRGGKKELFAKLRNELGKDRVFADSLDTNYRSSSVLVDFVNKTFNGFIPDYTPQMAHKKDTKGFIKIVSSKDEDMILSIVNLVNELKAKGVSEHNICILCWKNSDVANIANALENVGIGARKEGVLPLISSPLVYGLISYVKYCLFSNRIYAHRAKEFLNLKKLPTKLNLDPNYNAAETLRYLACSLKLRVGDVDLLYLYEKATSSGDIISFIFDLENQNISSVKNTTSGVQVMTVHKSKGLEFSHVLLCDIISAGNPNNDEFIIEYDSNCWQIYLRKSGREYLDKDYAFILDRSKKLQAEEEFNKLYVAFTRAKKSLTIIKNTKTNARAPSYFMPTVGTKDNPDGILHYLNLQDCEFGALDIDEQTTKSITKQVKKNILIKQSGKDSAVLESIHNEIEPHSIHFGLAFHYLMELSVSFKQESITQAFDIMCSQYGRYLSQEELLDIKNRALAVINNNKFIETTFDAKILKEQSIIVNNSLKVLDLLAIKSNQIIVIDYKTGRSKEQQNITQVREYISILKQLYKDMPISGLIFYALRNYIDIVEVEI